MRLIILVPFLFSIHAISQTGRISGVILDSKTGETLPGAAVLVEGTSKGAQADFDGKFAINNVTVGKVNLVVSYISYTSKKITGVNVVANDNTEVNIQLDASSSQSLTEVVVVATLNKENNTALVLQQKNNSSVSDGISAETIKRTPDRNASDVLKRISGVTIQDDKFVIIRGLNERYNASFLNGSPLPSTEADKKAFSFNLIPSNMLDNIVINKTATPDMPSEFAGGIVFINTKSIPERDFISVSTSLGYNTITTGKQKTIYNGGKYDDLGFDDGSRNLPSHIPAYSEKSTWISTAEQGKMAKNFENDWAYSYSKFAPNVSGQLAAGYNLKNKEKDFLGIMFSLSYNTTQSLYNIVRTEYEELSISGENLVLKPIEQKYISQVNQSLSSSAALLNLTFKLNSNNSISIKNILSGSNDNKFIHTNGTNNYNEQNIIRDRINTRYFSNNRLITSQINGDHLLSKPKIKLNYIIGYSNIRRSVPNMRFTSYGKYDQIKDFDPSVGPNLKDTVYRTYVLASPSTGPDYSGFRVYSALDEAIKSVRFDGSRLFKFNDDFKIDVKTGGFYQDRTRQYNLRRFGLSQYSTFQGAPVFFDDSLLYVSEDKIFATENMGLTNYGKGGFKAIEDTKPDDNYRAVSRLYATYGMGEIMWNEKIRIITGLRFERYFQSLNVQYDKIDSVYVKSTVDDLLPSVNAIYNISETAGLRLAYYKTLNRPEFRELAAANWYDPESRLSNAGNPNLQRCYIQNFDARFEIYPGRGQLFTITGFYKYFNNPIERYMLPGNAIQVYYRNANLAVVSGTELEYRINAGAIFKLDSVPFWNNLTLFSNLSLIQSQVNVKGLDDGVPETRQMQGQAPYIINTGISYVDNIHYMSFTATFNQIGPRLYIVGSNIIPNRWEKPRPVLDLQATKSFLKNKLEIRLNAKDILQTDWLVYYKGTSRKSNSFIAGKDYETFRRNYGGTYSFIISYRF